MSHTYLSRRKVENKSIENTMFQSSAPGPSLQELAAGAQPSQSQMGRRVDLPEAIRGKMEASFGADFSNVKLYESQTVADAGAKAMTMGSSIGFAPGKLDLASTAGQAMLGHELSHVVSQARGEVHSQGFLADPALESRADREGALAAAGEQVYTGTVTPFSVSSVPAATAGAVQAIKEERTAKNVRAELRQDAADYERRSVRLGNRYKQKPGHENFDYSSSFRSVEEKRFVSSHLEGLSDEDQETFLEHTMNTSWQDKADMIRGEMQDFLYNTDLSGMAASSDKDAMKAYRRLSPLKARLNVYLDLLAKEENEKEREARLQDQTESSSSNSGPSKNAPSRKRLTAEELGMTKEEVAAFEEKMEEYNVLSTAAQQTMGLWGGSEDEKEGTKGLYNAATPKMALEIIRDKRKNFRKLMKNGQRIKLSMMFPGYEFE